MEGPPPHAQMMQLISGKLISMMIDVVATLKVADQLKDGPKTADEIAAAVGAHGGSLYRVMRALTPNVFSEQEGKKFSNTPLGDTLRVDHPQSTRGHAMWLGGPCHSKAWLNLKHSVLTGEPCFPVSYGQECFPYFASHPDDLAIFQGAMSSLSDLDQGLVERYDDFTPYKSICDIGGGHGNLLAMILSRAPEAKGTLYEMPSVVAGAEANLKARGLGDRTAVVGGDFFESVPQGMDMYTMKFIIHDHDDAKCEKILTECRKGLNRGGRVLVMDGVLPGPNVPCMTKVIDVEMMAMLTGKERTKEEFAALFAKCGLRLNRVIEGQGHVSIVEAVEA